MEKYISEFSNLFEEVVSNVESTTIALSGGLDSTIIAYHMKSKIKGIAVIAQDFVGTDLTYCQIASKEFRIPLTIKSATTSEILDAIEQTIRILGNFNDIEIRNNLIMYIVLKEIQDKAEKGILTGDGADELFAGYDFILNKEHEELKKELKRMWKIMHFPTQKIAKDLGVKVESPFLDKKIIDFAKKIPATSLVNVKDGKKYGKWILRQAYQDKLPLSILWRKKSPMQEGSGTAELSKLFAAIISDTKFEDKKNEILKKDGVKIRTKESLYYYEIFRKYYSAPEPSKNNQRLCPFCNSSVESKFCRMCGAYPV